MNPSTAASPSCHHRLLELFQCIPWSSERVLAETEARARRLGADVPRLAERYDVDTASDLGRLIRTLLGDGRSAARAPRTWRFCQREPAALVSSRADPPASLGREYPCK